MSGSIQQALLSLLGFIGLGAVGLLPYRSWRLLQSLLGRGQRTSQKALSALALVIVVAVLGADIDVASRIHQCLTHQYMTDSAYCGPSVGSGWIYLSMLGAVYLAFELVGNLMQRVHRAVPSDDPIDKAVSTRP